MKDLPRRDDGHIPKSEKLHPVDADTMAQIEELSKDQAQAVAMLAMSSAQTAENTEALLEVMEDIKDLLVKVIGHFAAPLPGHIIKAMADKEYNPDEGPGEDEDEDKDEADEVP